MSELVSIVYKPESAPAPAAGYTRVPLQQAILTVGRGIQGDTKGLSAGRQLNVMSASTVESLSSEGFAAGPGSLGEQLIVAGINIDALPEGTRLRIGSTAIVELAEPRTGCAKFERYQGKLREEAANRLGKMASVVVSGPIRIGDAVVIEPANGTDSD